MQGNRKMKFLSRCKICNGIIWFDNVRYWASHPTNFDCCIKCYHKIDVEDDYIKWRYGREEIEK